MRVLVLFGNRHFISWRALVCTIILQIACVLSIVGFSNDIRTSLKVAYADFIPKVSSSRARNRTGAPYSVSDEAKAH